MCTLRGKCTNRCEDKHLVSHYTPITSYLYQINPYQSAIIRYKPTNEGFQNQDLMSPNNLLCL